MKENYLNYINNLRGFVIILIVSVHCLSGQLLQWSATSDLRELLHLFLHGSSIYFIFIAGFLFQYLISKYDYASYLRRKFLFVILPYLLVSIPAILDELHSPKSIYADLNILQQIVIYYLTGIHMAHFWFIPMIALFYLASPLFLKLDQNPRFYWMLPALLLISVFIPREIYPTHNPLQSALHFLSFYILGMWVCHYQHLLLKWVNYCAIGIILFILLFALHWFAVHSFGENALIAKALYVSKFTLGCFILVALFYKFDKTLGNSLNFLAEPSFGIYFIHNYFVVLFEKILMKLHFTIPANFFTFLMWVFIITACSYLTLMIVKRLFGKNSRMLVGY